MPRGALYRPLRKPFPPRSRVKLGRAGLLRLFRELARIRKAEEKVVEVYPKQEMRCPTHLSIGQEAVPVGVSAALSAEDHAYSGHRCHAHYLAEGGGLLGFFGELYGRAIGCARGLGGSMHLMDPSVGLIGSSALVGGTIPEAAGSALAFKMRGEPRVAVCYFGDAGVEEGVFYETYLFAVLRSLPVVFVCENNNYATNTPLWKRQPPKSILERVRGLGGRVRLLDGNNVLDVFLAAREAAGRARKGQGPFFFECRTYRWLEHVGYHPDYDMGYRLPEEGELWKRHCPVALYRDWLIKERVASKQELAQIEEELQREVNEAEARARGAAPPPPEALLANVYA